MPYVKKKKVSCSYIDQKYSEYQNYAKNKKKIEE